MSSIQAVQLARLAPGKSPVPAQWILDKIAEEKLTGGFNTRRSNRCDTCFTAKSANGSCACTD